MKLKIFATRKQAVEIDFILLLIRIVCGIAFIIVGWGKIQHPLNWMPVDPFPGLFQALAAISEFVGGIALILGLLTRLAVFGIGCTMTVAVYMTRVVWGTPFINMTGGNSYVLPLVLLTIALLFLLTGPGRFSLDRLIFGITSNGDMQLPSQHQTIEVFKTNVQEPFQAKKLVSVLLRHFPGSKINFDLDDCDKILRVEGENFRAAKVMMLVKENGFMCKVLE